MKPNKTMQAIITKIAAKYGLDLTEPGGHLKLTMPNMPPLVIKTLPGNEISVAHHADQMGDVMRDPEIVFYRAQDDSDWYAVEVTQARVGAWRRVAEMDSAGRWRVKESAQAHLASFVRVWAKNLREQGWLQHGEVTE